MMIIKALGLALANIAAPLVTLIATPLIARYYSPEDFGQYFYYLSIATICALVTTAQIFHGIYAAKTKRITIQLYIESIFFACLSNAFLLICILLYIKINQTDGELNFLIFVVILSVALSLNQIQLAFFSRTDKIKTIGFVTVFKSFVLILMQIYFALSAGKNSNSLLEAMIGAEMCAFFISLFISEKISKTHFFLAIKRKFFFTRKNRIFLPLFAKSGYFFDC